MRNTSEYSAARSSGQLWKLTTHRDPEFVRSRVQILSIQIREQYIAVIPISRDQRSCLIGLEQETFAKD